ncbi:putative F-box associated domain, type 1 [Rosa chinensis]|uniref:Putative F-box associated domain, type 1 n=1 Tax=Rosa chinensis TaxID=74649 RepID=A0A2P6S672_ROSCH|nr:putative F-box associated domain, type 1 [Rosa chinensis]
MPTSISQHAGLRILPLSRENSGPELRLGWRLCMILEPAILVSQNGMLYWKAVSAERAYIITYDLQTELVGRLVAPGEDHLNNVELVLGHGFKGQLAASVYVPPAHQEGHSYLHIWVLLKELAMYHWHKLVALPCHDYTSDGEVFVTEKWSCTGTRRKSCI